MYVRHVTHIYIYILLRYLYTYKRSSPGGPGLWLQQGSPRRGALSDIYYSIARRAEVIFFVVLGPSKLKETYLFECKVRSMCLCCYDCCCA